ncbi:uncharacterized protein LOC110024069 isoform X2 [Phalaenopsis equestris]|uniref:uncharacterized protein LOC110024069 isoform X2 n=1 Tax=Phalaenopsis equestris TaxID=78828 RepID=UPI0009E1B9CD|nr:uncharacterized protein LOC110024069 isoform X2 [Phalaenopsis equestris]
MEDSAFTRGSDNAVLSEKFLTSTNQNCGEKEITPVPFGNFINESCTKAENGCHGPCRSTYPLEALRSVETGMSDRVVQPAPTERTTNASTGKITDFSSSNHLVKTCSRWVKRLQHKDSETLSPCTKRYKKCDFSSSEMQNMHRSRMQNYYTMSHDVNRCMDEHKIEKTMTFSEIGSSSLGEIEEVLQSWIRRWRCNGHQICPAASMPIAPVAFNPSEKLEGKKIASIEAMALMGKAINKCRPCRIRRREASLEWTC